MVESRAAPDLADLLPRLYYGYGLVAAAFVAQFVSTGALHHVAGSFMSPKSGELPRAGMFPTQEAGSLRIVRFKRKWVDELQAWLMSYCVGG